MLYHCNITRSSQVLTNPKGIYHIVNATNIQLQELLELLCHTNDTNLLVKTFTKLGVYILSNGKYSDQIIKCNPLYEKIRTVLNKGLQTKTKIALNLISAMMYIDSKERYTRKKSLYFHAQNMIRISGCLTVMSGLFMDSMMQRETWRALCQSLNEACCNSTINQTNCSHLVPMCISRSQKGDLDALSVLQSLLNSHDRNLDLYYDSNGLSIFTRETLKYSIYLELLNTILESSKPKHTEIIARSDGIFNHLRYIFFTYGNSSPIGQWISIILYSRRKFLGISKYPEDVIFNDNINVTNCAQSDNFAQDESYSVYRQDEVHSETATLIKNVLKEVMEYQTINKIQSKPVTAEKIINLKRNNYCNTLVKTPKCRKINPIKTRDISHVSYQRAKTKNESNLSFTFLLKQNEVSMKSRYCLSTVSKDSNSTYVLKSIKIDGADVLNRAPIKTKTLDESFMEFNPPVVSTPVKNEFISETTNNSFSFAPRFSATLYEKQRKITKNNEPLTTNVKNRSIGARFFNIINGSCTTIMQGFSKFKNVFKNKRADVKMTDDITNISTGRAAKNVIDCSYSFTNYMRKRDAFYANESKKSKMFYKSQSSHLSNNYSSCHTCNDTVMLKRKLAGDPELKESVRRLKLGINLYGCDFKKISRTFWARETYMTPEVLYNLYRKLIAK